MHFVLIKANKNIILQTAAVLLTDSHAVALHISLSASCIMINNDIAIYGGVTKGWSMACAVDCSDLYVLIVKYYSIKAVNKSGILIIINTVYTHFIRVYIPKHIMRSTYVIILPCASTELKMIIAAL